MADIINIGSHDSYGNSGTDDKVRFQPENDNTDFVQFLDADGGTPILNIDSTNERIGVGTTSPDSKLTVYDATDAKLTINGTSGGSGGDERKAILNLRIDNSNLWQVGTDNEASGASQNQFLIRCNDSDANKFLVIQQSGNVGVGTISPQAKLEIDHGSGTKGLWVKSGADAIDGITVSNEGITSSNFALLVYNGANKMTVDYDGNACFEGNVGVGVTDPDEKLEVNGNIKLTDYAIDRVWATEKVFNVLDFGAETGKVDILTDVTTTTSSTTITSATNPWTADDVGKDIWLKGAGAPGADLLTTIAGYVSAGEVTITTAVTTGDTNVLVAYGIDNTTAFSNALSAANAAGGGAVYAPSGRFWIAQTLTIPANVSLVGCWRGPHNAGLDNGTTLETTQGADDVDGTPFIALQENSCLKGLTIYYPNQLASYIISSPTTELPYPWTIRGGNADLQQPFSIIDVTIVNAYQAIDLAANQIGGCYLRNILVCALTVGIQIDQATDTVRFENVHINNTVWATSGDWSGLNVFRLMDYTLANLTGYLFQRVDWGFINNCDVIWAKIGIQLAHGSGIFSGDPTLLFSNCGVDICETAMKVDSAEIWWGCGFANCQFMGMVDITSTYQGFLRFANCSFQRSRTEVGTVDTHGTTTLTGDGTHFTMYNIGDTISVEGETVRTITDIANDESLTVNSAFSTTQSDLYYTVPKYNNEAIVLNGSSASLSTIQLSNCSLVTWGGDNTSTKSCIKISKGQAFVNNCFFGRWNSNANVFEIPTPADATLISVGNRYGDTSEDNVLQGKLGIATNSPSSGLHIAADAGGPDKGYITLEKLSIDPTSGPGTGKAILYFSSTGNLRLWKENAGSYINLG